jgi:hypothetical protein
MARRKHDLGIDRADLKSLAVVEEAIPLAAVSGKIRPVVDIFPERLDIEDVRADRGRRAGFLLQVLGGREMIRVGMSVKDPFDSKTLGADVSEDRVNILGGCRTRLLIEVEDRIDDGAFAACRIAHNVLDAPGPRVEEALHFRRRPV